MNDTSERRKTPLPSTPGESFLGAFIDPSGQKSTEFGTIVVTECPTEDGVDYVLPSGWHVHETAAGQIEFLGAPEHDESGEEPVVWAVWFYRPGARQWVEQARKPRIDAERQAASDVETYGLGRAVALPLDQEPGPEHTPAPFRTVSRRAGAPVIGRPNGYYVTYMATAQPTPNRTQAVITGGIDVSLYPFSTVERKQETVRLLASGLPPGDWQTPIILNVIALNYPVGADSENGEK